MTTDPSESAAPVADAPPASAASPDPGVRRRLWFEVAAVAALAVLPDVVSSLQHVASPPEGPTPSFRQQAIGLIARSVGVAVPVLYIMWRSGDGFGAFGLRRFRAAVDLPAGVGVWALAYVVYVGAWSVIAQVPAAVESAESWRAHLRLDEMFPRPSGAPEGLLLVVMSAANGFAEELVLCGLLLTRLEVLLGSTARAVAVSALAMASYHLYQGPVYAALILVSALVTTGLFAACRRLWPIAIAHAIADVVGYLGM